MYEALERAYIALLMFLIDLMMLSVWCAGAAMQKGPEFKSSLALLFFYCGLFSCVLDWRTGGPQLESCLCWGTLFHSSPVHGMAWLIKI